MAKLQDSVLKMVLNLNKSG